MEKEELNIDENMKAQKFGEYLLSLSPYERSVSGSRVKVILAFIESGAELSKSGYNEYLSKFGLDIDDTDRKYLRDFLWFSGVRHFKCSRKSKGKADEFKHLAIQCFACANGLPEATLREKTNVSMTNKHIWITVESDDGRIWKREREIITDADYINRPFMQRISVNGKQWVANLINGKACELGDDITTRDERKARKAIGDKISMLRMKKGMTVKQLAEAANITPSNLSRIENYRYSPGLDVLARICDALGAELKIE